MTDESPAEAFQRYLRENPPAPREKQPTDWPTRLVGALIIGGGIAFYGWLGWQAARGVGLVP